MRNRRHIILSLLLLVMQVGAVWAQPQFLNTTSFDTGDSLYYWSARIGARTYQDSVFDDTTTGYHVMNTCTYTPDLVGDSIIRSVYVRTTFYTVEDTVIIYDSIDPSIILDTVIKLDTISFLTDTCRDYGFDANMYRFYIYTQNDKDQFTVDTLVPGSGMSRIAPGYTTSIRLGCMVNNRGAMGVDSNDNLLSRQTDSLMHIRLALSEGPPLDSAQRALLDSLYPGLDTIADTAAFLDRILEPNHYGSQSLFYTMRVTPENALLIINYAIVARRYDHTAYDAGEFLVRIVRRDLTGQWANEPINDSLWYKVSAPQLATELPANGPWRAGSTGTQWPCRYVYKPWNKCAVNLSEYIGEDVRVEFYTSNCIYGVDPLYAYIAGDYTSPTLTSSGCPMGSSPFIDTLVAPAGLLGYEWFVSDEGPQEDLSDYAHLDTVRFRRLTGRIASNVFCPTLQNFVVSRHDTLTHQTFMCIMHSALDPAKPFISKLYANVYNHKPIAKFKTIDSCDRSLTFVSQAEAPLGDSLDPSSLYWVIYDDLSGAVVLDTLYGDSAYYHFDETRSYLVDQHIAIYDTDSTVQPCSAVRRSFCPVKGPTNVDLRLSNHILCLGTPLQAVCSFDSSAYGQWDEGTLQTEWIVDGVPLNDLTTPHYLFRDTILQLPSLAEGMHVIEVSTRNRFHCAGSVVDTVYVYERPRILVDPRSRMLCLGDSLTLTAFRDDRQLDSAWFEWSAEPPDTALDRQQGSPILYLSPTQDVNYTLHPSDLSNCQQEDITVHISVFDPPVPMLSYSPPFVDLDNPVLILVDKTPNAWSTRWTFDDGSVVSSQRVSHVFSSPSRNGVSVIMETCNRGCCVDTTITIPVDYNVLWVPNTFLPSDDENGYFSVYASQELVDFEIYIYNRRGLLVYRSRDPHFRWDGTDMNGRPLPQESYVYIIGYRTRVTGEYRYSTRGTVTLLR